MPKCSCGKVSNPTFGIVGCDPTHCVSCKLPSMIDVKNRKCHCGRTQPRFGIEGEKATHCPVCKSEHMVDVVSRRCQCGNSTSPIYNFPGKKPQFCPNCRLEGMVNVVSPKCSCGKARPNFGFPGGKASHCVACKLSGMENVASRRCACGKLHPNFGFPESTASRCSKCKEPGMVKLLQSKKCFCGRVRPSFALPGNKPSHCMECKTDLMVDVVSRRCVCGKGQACYGLEGQLKTHCAQCRLPGMTNHNKKCACGKVPSFSMEGEKPSHCAACKLHGMIYTQVKMVACASCGLEHRVDALKDGICYPCTQQRPRVELEMRAMLQEHFPDLPWSFDTAVQDIVVCSERRYRPDAYAELPLFNLIVECDEKQHVEYDRGCELKRVIELLAASCGKPLTIIRWNPDVFVKDGKRQRVTRGDRLEALRQSVADEVASDVHELLRVQYMFYDGDREAELHTSLAAALQAYVVAGS